MQNRYQKYIRMYPWLTKINSVEEYLAPDYYKALLKNYSFDGLPDIEYLRLFIFQQQAHSVLELGGGNGRVTDIALQSLPKAKFTLTDLSKRMIIYTQDRFLKYRNISYRTQDAISFLKRTNEKYDLVYTLWSFSHSVHQHVHRLEFERASRFIRSIIIKFVRNNLTHGGKFFLMHFDSMSDEQKILMRQWKRVFPAFADISHQSPSKRMLDSIFLEMDNHNEIVLSIQHLQGDPIYYTSQNELLEIYMNFHLETFFNQSPHMLTVLNDITRQSVQYRQKDGTYIIRPGCYIYTFEKL